MFAFVVTFLFISGNEAKAQSPINCDGSLNCPMPEAWRTRKAQVLVDGGCILSISFRYTRCCAGCNYIIDIESIDATNTWDGSPCGGIASHFVYYAIKLAIVELHKLETLDGILPITVKTNSCYVYTPMSWGKTELVPCSNLCCVTEYWVQVMPDYLTINSQQTLANGNLPPTCGTQGVSYLPNPDCDEACIGHFIQVPDQINLSDYPEVALCDLNCYWRLDGNKNVTEEDFIGPTNGEDFVVKTLNTEGDVPVLMERIKVDNNRKIDFKLNSWYTMPQITFDADYFGTVGSTIVDDPTIKIYRPTGYVQNSQGAYPAFPWWISVNANSGEPSEQAGSFNIWSGQQGTFVGEDNFSNMTKKFTILRNGNVGIGVVNPTHKLVVDGNILATSLKTTGNIVSGETICAKEVNIVENPACPWPDYVFTNDYKLLSFDELEKSISENGSLPGVPTADDVKSNGVELGRMQSILLQKVEELTLYVIQLNKDNQELLKRNNELENKLKSLKIK